jgi:hypothetical protein
MGCDIHLFVEVRDKPGEPWRLQPVHWSYEHDGKKIEQVGFDWRSYDIFAMLAGVRNGSGFAGSDTGDGFVPIAEPRGLPDDISRELSSIYHDEPFGDDDTRWQTLRDTHGSSWLGDHSHSYVTLRELLSYSWNKRTNKRGVVDPGNYQVFLDKGEPDSYSSDVSGFGVRFVSNKAMAMLVAASTFAPANESFWRSDRVISHVEWTPALEMLFDRQSFDKLGYYTRVQWSVSYKEQAGYFHSAFIPALSNLGYDKDDVRLVFGFDS